MKFIGKELKLWEIMKEGKNGEIYEITDCALTSYIGTKVKVQETQDYRGKYKTLVKPEANDNPTDASNIVTIFGCMGKLHGKRLRLSHTNLLTLWMRLTGLIRVLQCTEKRKALLFFE